MPAAQTVVAAAPALTLAMVESYHAAEITRELKDKLFLARAHALVVRAVIDDLLAPAFALTNYTVDGDGSPRRGRKSGARITCEADLYQTDEDCSAWYRTRDEILIAAGYEIRELGCGLCPALVAEANVITIENELLAHGCKHFGLDVERLYGDTRARALELFTANPK